MKEAIRSSILGLAVGDALGVPVEFTKRADRRENPVTEMIGNGTHRQPLGTWSDDSSLTFCTMDAFAEKGYDLQRVSETFVEWLFKNKWTPHGIVFDIGGTTRNAIDKLARGTSYTSSGEKYIESNGNGSLMRILPVAFMMNDKTIEERWQMVSDLSAITHAHPISRLACFYYVEFILNILSGMNSVQAYIATRMPMNVIMDIEENKPHAGVFSRLLLPEKSIITFPENEISSGGYVIDTLEASVYCVLTTSSYAEAVLKAVNMGGDTDTTGAVTGGLAGLIYGEGNIPKEWKEQLVGAQDISDLCNKFATNLLQK